MQILFIHCHLEINSFNRALTNAGASNLRKQGHIVEIADLYAEQFDPVEKASHYEPRINLAVFEPLAEQRNAYKTNSLPADVKREIDRLERADLVVFQFPIWWHSVPAMLKGWMDRVFISGGLYTSTMRYDKGYFKGRRAICSVTSGAPKVSFTPGGRAGEVDQILWSFHYSLYYMGFDVLSPYLTHGLQGHGFSYADGDEFKKNRELSILGWQERLGNLENEKGMKYPGWDDWDEQGRLTDPTQLSNKQ